ncbi:MAG TPA: tripartite tricarboxylate transporter permease, partial [Xanthobacteraceae bacterium]|nr:tripartite tricarboxylate transporter permease [Xanthobacteraceae bacterium]
DGNTGGTRFTFGMTMLIDGISFTALAIGIFGLGEVISNLVKREQKRQVISQRLRDLWPSREDFHRSWPAVLRGTALGCVVGILPGGGATLSSFGAYALEKKVSREPGRFGKGAVEGVAAPESANNAGAQTSFIPMLTLGIPGNAVMALMIGALTIHGIQPGPQVMTERPTLFWGLIASMWLGNLMLVIINLPMIGIWVQLLRVPYRMLYLCIIVFCAIGVYTVNNNPNEVILCGIFGVVGYVFIRLRCEPAPLVLGFVLGPLMEENLRRSMRISGGDPTIFFTRPISLSLLIAAAALLLLVALPFIRAKREEAFVEEEI